MIQSPFTLILSGATGSGITQWLLKFLNHNHMIIDPPPVQILYCYGEVNKSVLELRQHQKEMGLEVYHGVPDEGKIKEKEKPLLLILDDLMLNMSNNFLDILFTRGSHNWNVSVIFVTQSLYGRNIRTARSNSHLLC